MWGWLDHGLVGRKQQGGSLYSVFLTLKSQYTLTSHCFKNCPGVSPLAIAFLSLPRLSLTCPHRAVWWCLPEGQVVRWCWVVSAHTSLRTAISSRYHSVRYPLMLTQVKGSATFCDHWLCQTIAQFSLKDSTRKLQTSETNLVFIQLCNHFYVLSVFHTPWNGTMLCNWISCTVTQRH